MAFLGAARTLVACALLLTGAIDANGRAAGEDRALTEAQAKAAFLYNFALFVEWPPDAFQQRGDMAVCVVGADPVLGALRNVHLRSANSHTIIVRQITEFDDPRQCRILFVPAAAEASSATLLHALGKEPVLLVGEGEAPFRHRIAIRLYFEDSRPRFAIDPASIDRARLRVSSKMLGLAKSLGGETHAVSR